MTPLQALLVQAKADNSVDGLIAAAERRGHQLPRTFRATIYKALDGDHASNPRDETLQGFAVVFQVDVRKLREAVGAPAGELGPWKPPTLASRLNKDQRNALNELIRTMVAREEGERDERPAATKTPDSGPGSIIEIAGQAARKTGRPTRAQERRGRTQNRGEKDDASPS